MNISREEMYDLFNQLGYKIGCEIGVYRGSNAREMFKSIPELKLFCVDIWDWYGSSRNKEIQEMYMRTAQHKLRKYIEKDRAILIRKKSLDAVRDFEDESLDFVYIDANHNFDFVIRDIIEWSAKVRNGGIISGHDYYIRTHKNKVYLAVNSYVKAKTIRNLFITNQRKGRKNAGKYKSPNKIQNSFFWVKC